MDKESEKSCNICNKKFKLRSNVCRHMRRVHGVEPVLRKSVKCPNVECDASFRNYAELRKHVSYDHGIQCRLKVFKFATENDFCKWKQKVEDEMKCFYARSSSYKILANKERVYYYICHRTGHFERRSSGKRSLKSTGSNKICGHCPSTMQVKMSSIVTVIFCKTHYGHDSSLQRLPINMEQKIKIANKIDEGVSFETILEDVKSHSDEFSRMHLLTRRDLHNIKRDFCLSNNKKYKENNVKINEVNVEMWVNSMAKLGDDDPVISYKDQGKQDDTGYFKKEDFFLVIMTAFQREMIIELGQEKICVYSICGISPYNFYLTTLITIDELDTGYPVAFCVSSRIDTDALKAFFNSVKDVVGIIDCNVFISNDSSTYYNSWQMVMGTPEHRLLCAWQINRKWQKNLCTIKSDRKRILIYKALKELSEEPDIEIFKVMEESFRNTLQDDNDVADFLKYYCSHYAPRVKLWAFCYRKHLGANINACLESVHKVVKQMSLEGKIIKGLNETLNSLMKFVKSKMLERLIRTEKKVPMSRILQIKQSHRNSKGILSCMIQANVNNKEWRIKSLDNCTSFYTVRKILEPVCIDSQCKLRCFDCDACIHMHECTCLDNLIRCNICPHIHACVAASESNVSDSDFENTEDVNEINNSFDMSELQHFGFNSNAEALFTKKLKMLTEEIYDTQTSFSVSTYIQGIKILDKCIENFRRDKEKANISITNNLLRTKPFIIKLNCKGS